MDGGAGSSPQLRDSGVRSGSDEADGAEPRAQDGQPNAGPANGSSDRAGNQTWRVLGWTSLIGACLLGSALVGWFLLRGLAEPILAFLFAVGGGGMLYLTVTDLIPEAEERHYQQSAALAIAAGFLVILVLSELIGS